MEKKRRRCVNGELRESDGEIGEGEGAEEEEIVLVLVVVMRFLALCDRNLRILKKNEEETKGAIKRLRVVKIE